MSVRFLPGSLIFASLMALWITMRLGPFALSPMMVMLSYRRSRIRGTTIITVGWTSVSIVATFFGVSPKYMRTPFNM